MGDREFTKSEVGEFGVRGGPLIKWENRVKEYMRESGRGRLDQERSAYWNMEDWRIFC